MLLDKRACDHARRSRDARFDGRFFIAVTTTRVYCRPICPAFRPCLRCRPEASPGTPAWFGTSSVVSRALRLITEGALDHESADALADRLGVTARHLRRLFLHHLGATPSDVALTRRVHFAKKLLDETSLPFSEVAFAAGFGSVRRFNGQIRRTYKRTPSELRRLARHAPTVEPECYRFRLAYRPPYDWEAVLSFLRARATPGVEIVDGSSYRRTIAVDGKPGVITISRHDSGTALTVDVRFPDCRALLSIVERVRRMFDLSADPFIIREQLRTDPLLQPVLSKHAGIRVPGAWDGFELAVRAIVGQQISVRGATTIAGRVASLWGSKVDGSAGLVRLFPTPGQLMDANVERAGVMPARAETIRLLARRVSNGGIVLDAHANVRLTVAALQAIPGIGAWTAQYIAMRAFGEPDAFPSGDLVLRRITGHLSARALDRRSDVWRPWRAYAVMLLWEAANSADRSWRMTHAPSIKDAANGRPGNCRAVGLPAPGWTGGARGRAAVR